MVEDDRADQLEVWPLAEDIKEEEDAEPKKKFKQSQSWAPLFITEGFFEPHEKPNLDDYILKDRKLRMLAQRFSPYRQKLTEAAYKDVEQSGAHQA